MSGTSMATPHVSGALSLLLAHNPALTAAQACASVLDSGDLVSSLAGKTQTGRRLNVFNALRTDPPPVASTGTASSVTASGATLGGTIGSRCATTTWQFEYGPTQAYGTLDAARRGRQPVGWRLGDDQRPDARDDVPLPPRRGARIRAVHGRRCHFHDRDRIAHRLVDTRRRAAGHDTAGHHGAGGATQRSRAIAKRARVTCVRARSTVRCRVTNTTRAVRIRLVLRRRGRIVARASGLSGIRIKVRGGKPKPGRYTVTLTVLENDEKATSTKRIRIR